MPRQRRNLEVSSITSKLLKLIYGREPVAPVQASGSLDIVDLIQQKHDVQRPSAGVIDESRFTEAGLLASLVVQFTGRCNLRCVYCPQGTELNKHNEDVAEAAFIAGIGKYIGRHEVPSVHLGVYGETPFYDPWPKHAHSYLDAGAELSVTTNLHKHLSDEELDVLSRFQLIFVSIDTFNLPLMKKIRTADGKLVLYNFHQVRAHAIANNRPVPAFAWSVTLSTAIIPYLKDMLPLAKRYGVKYLFLNDLSSYDGLPHDLKNVFELEGSEFETAAATLNGVLEFCKMAEIQVHAPWKERLDKELEARKQGRAAQNAADKIQLLHYTNIQGSAHWFSEPLPDGMTRMCLQPWNNMVVMPKGEVYTCCQRGVSMGVANSAEELDAVRDGPQYVDLRRQLISGHVTDETCRNCQSAPAVTPDKLLDGVRNILLAKDAKALHQVA